MSEFTTKRLDRMMMRHRIQDGNAFYSVQLVDCPPQAHVRTVGFAITARHGIKPLSILTSTTSLNLLQGLAASVIQMTCNGWRCCASSTPTLVPALK